MPDNRSNGSLSRFDGGAGNRALLSLPLPNTLTYEPYFGLTEQPFSLSADDRFIYRSPSYVQASERLLGGVRRREGLLVLTGEIGTGKTTLCRQVLQHLGRHYSAHVSDPFASREDLLKILLVDFGVRSIQDVTGGPLRQASRTELGFLLSAFITALPADAYIVVVIDEAQNLSLSLIEETRILVDAFGATGRLQIVFVGQPELHAKLKLPEMRQVDQRVCGYHRLAPLDRDAVAGYINYRLLAAGLNRERVLFPPDIVTTIHGRSGGVPRLINRVCDRALHVAYERKAERVDAEILNTALNEVGAATLSPTWDSIIFAEPGAPHTAGPGPTRESVRATPTTTPPIDAAEQFKQEIENWLEQDLAPAPRMLVRAQERILSPKSEQSSVVGRESPPVGSATHGYRSERYMQRLGRTWRKHALIGVGVFAAFTAVSRATEFVPATATAIEVPAVPTAPTLPLPGLVLPQVSAPDAAVSNGEPRSVEAMSYFVAVGLFASRDRADEIVVALANEGLPAMQRDFQLRRQQVQQIVLGPYLSRSDAVADLSRLQQLGGYDDATVMQNLRPSPAH